MKLVEGIFIVLLTLVSIGLLILILKVKKDTKEIVKTKKVLENEINNGIPNGEVFHISNNTHTYHTAEEKCKLYGARLATEEELRKAHENGASWCNYGWVKGQKAMYPVQKKHYDKEAKFSKFGNPCQGVGVIGGYFPSPHHHLGVNCFGVKPKITNRDKAERDRLDEINEKREKILDQFNQERINREMHERKQRERIRKMKESLQSDVVTDFNQRKNQWSRYE